MALDLRILRSRVGHRILILFILCALGPIGALAVLSFTHVTAEFRQQNLTRIKQSSKVQGMAILERLLLAESQLKMITADLKETSQAGIRLELVEADPELKSHFNGFTLVKGPGRHGPIQGSDVLLDELNADQWRHLLSGQSLILTHSWETGPRIFMMRLLGRDGGSETLLAAELNGPFLWGLAMMAPEAELSVVESPDRVLYGPRSNGPMLTAWQPEQRTNSTGYFDWSADHGDYLAGYWSMFLKNRFLAPEWTVLISQSKASVLAPLTEFRRTFPLVTLITIWVVLLLSLIQIRRSLVPLERHQEGTRRIAEQDFGSRVTVTSGDEFEELADAFNTMATRIAQQFNVLKTINEIDRSILSSADSNQLAVTLIHGVQHILPCDMVGVTFLEQNGDWRAQTYLGGAHFRGGENVISTTLEEDEVEVLRDTSEAISLHLGDPLPGYVAPLAAGGMKSFLLLPIITSGRPSGIISLAHRSHIQHQPEDLVYSRQITSQIAVALASAHSTAEKKKLKGLFERYVSPEVASEIFDRRQEISLTGEEKTATVLFSDIRGFTRLTSGRPSAEVLSWLNSYFEAMSEVVLRHGGFLNKFLGDGLMVVFGVPLSAGVERDACKAVRTALEMLTRVDQLNAEDNGDWPLRIGIGIHTGSLTVGNVGAKDRLEYSVIGETVNFASRLEGMTKSFEAGLVLSEQTRELVRGEFETKLLDQVGVRGFDGKKAVYTVTERVLI